MLDKFMRLLLRLCHLYFLRTEPESALVASSLDGRRVAANGYILYERTHTNEDGVEQFEIVGVTEFPYIAELWLKFDPCRVQSVTRNYQQV